MCVGVSGLEYVPLSESGGHFVATSYQNELFIWTVTLFSILEFDQKLTWEKDSEKKTPRKP